MMLPRDDDVHVAKVERLDGSDYLYLLCYSSHMVRVALAPLQSCNTWLLPPNHPRRRPSLPPTPSPTFPSQARGSKVIQHAALRLTRVGSVWR